MTRRRTESTPVRLLAGLLLFGFCCGWPSGAGVRSRAIRELAEALVRKAGKEASDERNLLES